MHHFVVKIVQIPRSPIFEAMGHTSVFPIGKNEVAEVVVLFSQQNPHLCLEECRCHARQKMLTMDSTKAYSHCQHFLLAEAGALLYAQMLILYLPTILPRSLSRNTLKILPHEGWIWEVKFVRYLLDRHIGVFKEIFYLKDNKLIYPLVYGLA